MDVRVRLVFADDVGRHVQRRRGFSSCWYLVPTEAKLVGDLAHALLLEFGLRKRCPKGLELRLEELPLLATQSIRVVRDNDTVVVHCPPLESEDNGTDASSSESEVESSQPRKRKLPVKKKTEKQPRKKAKAVKAPKRFSSVYSILKAHAAKVQKSKVESSSSRSSSSSSSSDSSSSDSSSSSSDSSSDSSSSSSDSEDPYPCEQKKKSTTPTTPANKQQVGKANAADSVKTSNGVVGKSKVPEPNGKGPRRRRRRSRQRNGSRTRNTKQTEMAESAASHPSTNDIVPNRQEQSATALEQANQGSSSERLVRGTVGDSRRFPHASGHVLFDEETGDQVVVQRDNLSVPATRTNNWADRQSQAPELAKYGPSSSGNQQPGDSRATQHQSSSTEWTNKSQDSNGDSSASKRNGKGKYEERWKRPYEIVASVLDKEAEESSGNNSPSPDLTKSLASYPTGSAETSRFKPKDVIAFKTLTLCLETWQPVLSDWKCGQVQSVDGNSIEVSSWTLRANGASVDFCEVQSGEQYAVQKSELSELRFLSGPSYSFLLQTAA